jgi:LysM repeat protein
MIAEMARRIAAVCIALMLFIAPAWSAQAEAAPQPVVHASVRIVQAGQTEAEAHALTGYVVRRGDTLSGIASRLGISSSSLMRANGIRNADRIFIGQRLIVPSTGGPVQAPPAAAPSAPNVSGKSIVVSISKQRMFLYEGEQLIKTLVVSTGERGRETAAGNYKIQTKLPEAYASIWQLRMPYWMGIYYVGRIENGIHALPINKYGQTMWGGLLGRPASYGCVILGNTDAAMVYNWAPMGTPVIIRN